MHLPGAAWLTHLMLARSRRTHRFSGTVTVSAVGMFTGGSGFAIGVPTELSLAVTVGGLGKRPRVVDGQFASRDVLELTVSIDHYVVDGAPAARFGADLRRILESGEVL